MFLSIDFGTLFDVTRERTSSNWFKRDNKTFIVFQNK